MKLKIRIENREPTGWRPHVGPDYFLEVTESSENGKHQLSIGAAKALINFGFESYEVEQEVK